MNLMRQTFSCMSAALLPAYSPVPSYASLPREGDSTVEYTPRAGRQEPATGTITKRWRSLVVIFKNQSQDTVNAREEIPTYGRNSAVVGELSVDNAESVRLITVRVEGILHLSSTDTGSYNQTVVNEQRTVWDTAKTARLCPSLVGFAVAIPMSYKEDDKSYRTPPSYEAICLGSPLIVVKCSYRVIFKVTRANTRRLSLRKISTKTHTTPIIFRPRNRPARPIIENTTFLASLKIAPAEWIQTVVTIPTRQHEIAHAVQPITCHFLIPSVQTFCLNDTIPFHIQLCGSPTSLALFYGTITPESLQPGKKPRRRHYSAIVRVFLARQIYLSNVNGRESWRTMTIGEGKIRPVVPPADHFDADDASEIAVNWEGQVSCKNDVDCASFNCGHLVVKDFIVLALTPANNRASALLPAQHAQPLRFVTDGNRDDCACGWIERSILANRAGPRDDRAADASWNFMPVQASRTHKLSVLPTNSCIPEEPIEDLSPHFKRHRTRAPLPRTLSAPSSPTLISTTTTQPFHTHEMAANLMPRADSFNARVRGTSHIDFRTATTGVAAKTMRNEISHLVATVGDAATKKAFDTEMQAFFYLFTRYLSERAKSQDLDWDRIKSPADDQIVPYANLPKPSDVKNLNKLAVLKVNGGLGTSMGMTGAKSALEVKDDMTFLDLTVRQIEHLNTTNRVDVPLILMTSFNTHEDTLRIIKKYANQQLRITTFNQSRYPRIYKESLVPCPTRADDDKKHWYPPGHGDLYNALLHSGVLDQLLAEGKEYLFVSNSDNLGAVVDESILQHMMDTGAEFIMEVTDKTKADIKGGTLIDYEGSIRLLEIAQVPSEHVEDFKSIRKFKIFNTNNLWINLKALKRIMEQETMELEIIINPKVTDDGQSVIQLETAAGAAIKHFKNAHGINVPRKRFLPVKSCSDLLLIKSDIYSLEHGQLVINAARMFDTTPVIKLGDHFKKIQNFQKRFKKIPKILELDHLTVSGDVSFGRNVTLRGTVIIVANEGQRIDIPDGCVLENRLVSGNLNLVEL
ncbi:UTP-glucose-1-phosphate uridylyltransferase [Mycena kentingensis (nom. inval.)]|nr:UTP-glucose-1-phosphate uridylyltransferase [Mycena kentingensis (nom. inval.)]